MWPRRPHTHTHVSYRGEMEIHCLRVFLSCVFVRVCVWECVRDCTHYESKLEIGAFGASKRARSRVPRLHAQKHTHMNERKSMPITSMISNVRLLRTRRGNVSICEIKQIIWHNCLYKRYVFLFKNKQSRPSDRFGGGKWMGKGEGTGKMEVTIAPMHRTHNAYFSGHPYTSAIHASSHLK